MIQYYVTTTKGGISKGETAQMAFARMPPAKKVDFREFLDFMGQRGSRASRGLMKGFLSDMSDALALLLCEGRRVDLGDIGSFSLSLKSEAAATADDFSDSNIKGVSIVFTPSRYLRQYLADIKFKRISIDRKGYDANFNDLLKNKEYETELEEHSALCGPSD